MCWIRLLLGFLLLDLSPYDHPLDFFVAVIPAGKWPVDRFRDDYEILIVVNFLHSELMPVLDEALVVNLLLLLLTDSELGLVSPE